VPYSPPDVRNTIAPFKIPAFAFTTAQQRAQMAILKAKFGGVLHFLKYWAFNYSVWRFSYFLGVF
jgi:hypothetical protein